MTQPHPRAKNLLHHGEQLSRVIDGVQPSLLNLAGGKLRDADDLDALALQAQLLAAAAAALAERANDMAAAILDASD